MNYYPIHSYFFNSWNNILLFVFLFIQQKIVEGFALQALFNYRRKSTIGWSIWNVLLDLTGGTLDLLQIVLQAVNVANWSAFIGNPVKFGLGFVSIFFDIIFIVQHYVLYKDVDVVHANYVGMENQIVRRGSDETLSVEPPVADDSALTT